MVSLRFIRNSAVPFLGMLVMAGRAWAEPPLLEIKHQGNILVLLWSTDGKTLISAGETGIIHVTEIPSGKEVNKIETQEPISGLVISPDGKTFGVKSALPNGALSLWDVSGKKHLRKLSFQGYTANQLAFSPDGGTLAASGPGEHMVWNHAKGGGYGSRMGKVPAGSFAAASPDEQFLAWSDPQGNVNLYATDQRRYQRMQVGPARSMTFSPDSKLLAVGQEDKTVKLWQIGGTEGKKFEGLREPAALLAFSGNGKVLAGASAGDPVVRIWDVGGGRLRRRLTANPLAVQALALAPDGRTLALAGNGKVLVWNVATRELGDLGPAKVVPETDLQKAWTDLADQDYGKSEAAFRTLAAAGNHALPFLDKQVRAVAVPPINWKRVAQLLVDLDSTNYAVRQKATEELGRFGELIQVPLQKFLATRPPLEAQRRAAKLLDRTKDPELTPDRLRSLEVIEILESLRTPEARHVLDTIARDALITQIRTAAFEALERLKRK